MRKAVHVLILLPILAAWLPAFAQQSKPAAAKPTATKSQKTSKSADAKAATAAPAAPSNKDAAASEVASPTCPPCELSEAQKLKLELAKARQQVILNEIIWRQRQAQIPDLQQQAQAIAVELAGAADAARKANGWPEGTTFNLQCFLAPRPQGAPPADAHECYVAPPAKSAEPEKKK